MFIEPSTAACCGIPWRSKKEKLTREEQIWCISSFSHGCRVITWGRKTYSGSQFRGYSPAWSRRHGCGTSSGLWDQLWLWWQKAACLHHGGSGSRGRGPSAQLTPRFSFYSVWIPVYGMVPYIEDGSFPLGQSSLETPSQAYSEECLTNALGIY